MKMTFGKYFGWDTADLPDSYIRYMLEERMESNKVYRALEDEAHSRGISVPVKGPTVDAGTLALCREIIQAGRDTIETRLRRRRQKGVSFQVECLAAAAGLLKERTASE